MHIYFTVWACRMSGGGGGYSKETHPFLMRSNQFVMLMLCAALPADDTSALRRVYVMGPGRVRPGVFAAGAVDIFCRSRSQHTEVPPKRKLGGNSQSSYFWAKSHLIKFDCVCCVVLIAYCGEPLR